MSSTRHPIGSTVFLRQDNGLVQGEEDSPAPFRVTAIDKVPRNGVWYRLTVKDRTLQKVHGGWHPAARVASALPKLAAQAAPHKRRMQGLHVAVDGTVRDLTLPTLYASQQALFRNTTGSFARLPIKAGERAVCIAGGPATALLRNQVASRAAQALTGDTTTWVYGHAVFVGPHRDGYAWTGLPSDVAAVIRAHS